MKKLLALLLLSSFARAGDIVIGSFQGLNTQDNPIALEDGEAQDLLNVGITPGGKSVYKREGYGLHKTLSYSTSAVHGLYYFQDTSGANIHLYGHDAYLAASVNGASSVDISTGTVNATWQCTDNFGFAYCVNSSRDTGVRTSGTVGTTSFIAGIPKGTMITSTPDRLVVAGVSGAESSLYFSQANTFTNFTVGVNSADPFIEVINSPGSRITHIRYACGKVLWWKDGSFGYTLGSDQYNLEDVVVSPNIGTLDNSSDEYNGIVYFRGQDNHIYQYDCSNVTRLSRKITPTVQGSSRRRSNSWTQTTASNWNDGSFFTSVLLSSTVSSGDITQSSFTDVDTSSDDFTLGNIFMNVDTTTVVGSIYMKAPTVISQLTYNGSILTTFETGQSFTTDSDATQIIKYLSLYCSRSASPSNITVNIRADSGSDTPSSVSLSTNVFDTSQCPATPSFSWINTPLTATVLSPSTKYWVNIGTTSCCTSIEKKDSDVYSGGHLYRSGVPAFDDDDLTFKIGILKYSTSSFTSQTFDIGLTSSVVHLQSNWTVNTSTPIVGVITASNSTTGPWVEILTSTGISATANRYVRYVSTLPVFGVSLTSSSIQDVTVVAKSTGGVYYSNVNYASGVSQWSTLEINDETSGGSITHYVRASTGSFTVNSSTPIWASQSVNSTVNYATGTYMQLMSSFTTTTSTGELSLNDFTFNWTEGNASDKAYIKYWNDYVWVAVSSGTTGLNNRIQRWDILNQAWLLDDIPSNGFLVDNDNLYFGSPSAGKIYKYGAGVTTDDSSDITSYWKSKNFAGDDPFVTKSWDQADFVVKAASPTIMDVIYQLDGSTSTVSYTMNLYHPTKTILHKGVNLAGKLGWYYNVRFGDTSDHEAWEVFGYRAKYSPWTWRPE